MKGHGYLKRFLLLFVAIVVCSSHAFAKRKDDVVILKNGDRMTGEIKSLQQGELRFKAGYMADSVRLDWTQVESLQSKDLFQILLKDGQLFTDELRILPGSSTDNFLIGGSKSPLKVPMINVVRILPIEGSFWSQLTGSIDFGFNFTSGTSQYQTELNATANYRRGDHSVNGTVNTSFSGQSDADSSARKQFTLDYRKQVSPRWFVGGLFDLLSSDQQNLNLRTTLGGSIGRNIIQTERTRFSLFGGVAASREKYSTPLHPKATNIDALAGADFVTFRFKTTNIGSRLVVFPSLTDPGRVRMQVNSSLKIELVKDLYWGFNLYENFDSRPPFRADKNDLGISASLGWKF